MKSEEYMRSEYELRRRIMQALNSQPELAGSQIGVLLDEGIVILLGRAQSSAARSIAEETARQISKLPKVANEISVRLPDFLPG